MPGLFGGKKLERGLVACRLVVPLMQESRLMLRLAKELREFGLLRVAVCVARAKCCSMRQHPMRKKKIPNAYLEMNKLLALSANIILRLRTAERMITPKRDHRLHFFPNLGNKTHRWHVGMTTRDPPTAES
jgi:hypothetical protein